MSLLDFISKAGALERIEFLLWLIQLKVYTDDFFYFSLFFLPARLHLHQSPRRWRRLSARTHWWSKVIVSVFSHTSIVSLVEAGPCFASSSHRISTSTSPGTADGWRSTNSRPRLEVCCVFVLHMNVLPTGCYQAWSIFIFFKTVWAG